jgi:hypothetical protein
MSGVVFKTNTLHFEREYSKIATSDTSGAKGLTEIAIFRMSECYTQYISWCIQQLHRQT